MNNPNPNNPAHPKRLGRFDRLTMHWIFAGFRQTESTYTNGMVRLSELLHDELRCKTNRIFPRSYRDNAKEAAIQCEIIRQAKRVRENQLTIRVAAYSYGCTTATKFCKELEEVGLRAESVVLCDPVKRFSTYAILHRRLRRAVDWLGMAPNLELPASVGQVVVFAQDVARPWPCQVFHGGELVKPIMLPYDHTAMDNSPEFRECVLNLAMPGRMVPKGIEEPQ